MDWMSDPAIWASLITLTALEVVLGIDNVIFVSIVVDRLPEAQRATARRIGLGGALVLRLLLLSALSWLIGLTAIAVTLFEHAFSWRDLILLLGGLFLIYKGTKEIHGAVEGEEETNGAIASVSFAGIITQVMILDLVFSLDSVITAIGIAEQLGVMVAAVIISMIIMIAASGPLSRFISRHPTTKMLALSFLLLVGMTLIADGLGFHMPRGYVYAAMAFSVTVEVLNLLAARRRRA